MNNGVLPAELQSYAHENPFARKMLFRAYALCIFTMVFCVNAPAPLFELFRRANGLTPSELSMLYAVYAGIVIVALPVFGCASDRFGRRALVALGLVFIAVGSLVLAVADSFSLLISGRFLQGLGVAAMSAPAASALAELTDIQGQASAASTVALAIGGAAAPLFSGIAAEAFPAFPTSPLLVCAGMAFVGVVSIALLPDPWHLRLRQTMSPPSLLLLFAATSTKPSDDADAPGLPLVSNGSYRMAFWQACTAVVVCFGAQVTFFTVSGPLVGSLLDSHVLLAAGCAMSALMVASSLGGLLARRLGAKAAITSGMSLLAPGVCSFFGLINVIPLLALTPAITAIGLGHGLGYAGAMRLINETAPSAHRAAYTSKFYIAIYIGGCLPVLGMGGLEGQMGQEAASAAFSFVIAVIAISLLTSLWLIANKGHRN